VDGLAEFMQDAPNKPMNRIEIGKLMFFIDNELNMRFGVSINQDYKYVVFSSVYK
jgi:hypothetical protein